MSEDASPALAPLEAEEGFIDISEARDGGLLKKILVEGVGEEIPPAGSHVSVHYVGTLHSDGSTFDSSRDRPGTFDFEVGIGQVIKGWDTGICTMRKGEKAILRARSDYAYGDHGSPPKIPGGATLDFEVELFRWRAKELEDMTGQERSDSAARQKESGNAAFSKQNWALAVEEYEEGIRYVMFQAEAGGHRDHGHTHGGMPCSGHGHDDESEDEDTAPKALSDEDKKLAIALFSNCAAARLKVNDAGPAVEDCSKALELDAANVKALFRRAQGQLALGNYSKALADAKHVVELDKENKPAEQLMQRIAVEEKKAKKKEKDMFAKMFG